MNPLIAAWLALSILAADPKPTDGQSAAKPIGTTRDDVKRLLEEHKRARPRLPMPPADPANPLARVHNGAFRAHYLPAKRPPGWPCWPTSPRRCAAGWLAFAMP
jgi:hypothetical protein